MVIEDEMFGNAFLKHCSGLTTPAAPAKVAFGSFFLMARPPLLSQEGNPLFSYSLSHPLKSLNSHIISPSVETRKPSMGAIFLKEV